MIEQIREGIYRIEVPLPGTPLKAVNNYYIHGGDGRSLWIDLGFQREVCRQAVLSAMEELKVDRSRTDFFLTHMHEDHSGLIRDLATGENRVYCSKIDGETVRQYTKKLGIRKFTEFSKRNAPELLEHYDEIMDSREPETGPPLHGEYIYLKEDDILRIGKYRLCCVDTPGHTEGHLCLYEEGQRLFFSGDHILGRITPNITKWDDNSGDVLGTYLNSLERLRPLKVETVLPGHRMVFSEFGQRIDELQHHHKQRLAEVLGIVGDRFLYAWQVASHMQWSLTYKNWSDFPVAQQLYATGEALSHLYYLHKKGRLAMMQQGDQIVFRKK